MSKWLTPRNQSKTLQNVNKKSCTNMYFKSRAYDTKFNFGDSILKLNTKIKIPLSTKALGRQTVIKKNLAVWGTYMHLFV